MCGTVEEMAEKLRIVIEGHAPSSIQDGSDFSAFAESRSWVSVAEEYLAFFAEAKSRTKSQVNPWASSDPEVFIMDVTNACRDPANSGCVRVARRLAEQLQAYHSVLFVVWDRQGGVFRFPTSSEFQQLGSFQGPTFAVEHPVSGDGRVRYLTDWLAVNQISGGWLIMPEIRHSEDFFPILNFVASASLRTAAIFHDAIPVLRPDLVADPIYREGHDGYMKALACCELVVAISHFSEDCLRKFWSANSLSGRATTCLLPGGFTGHRPVDKVVVGLDKQEKRRTILCVSTLEPRKNHLRLIESFLALEAESPEFSWELLLVGSEIHSAPELAQSVMQSARDHSCIKYLGIVPDEKLAQLYGECEFTVYPSVIEGFGLPIMESVWYSRPCLCHKGGVMEELASEGGCLAVDLQDTRAMKDAMRRLMTDPELRERLREECRNRPVKRWSDYAAEFLALLAQVHRSELEHYTPSI
jgi:glycosyltransferase involved in cell wall biosynthesis